ncbi:MAG TPA: UDP-glucose/GDP-mannose dehydrogenase family protein [Pirellulales bacterium]|nr:UDP-glucose/GDP-mannose dehydrogenase family protein [Pirellulales bacterium]
MKIAVIGTGYVGLVTGTCLAESGNDVSCVDIDAGKIRQLSAGEIPIYEPGLEELVRRNTAADRLRFSTDLRAAVSDARLIFLAVGTPQAEDGTSDLKHVWAVVDELAPHVTDETIVITKSTVPVGTNAKIRDRIASRRGKPCHVASNPEFLKEGAAIEDFMKPDRVVVGVRDAEVAATLRDLYSPFLRTEKPFLVMSPESAEMTKYAANAMLATKISFINEVANLCERIGADVDDVRRGIGHDARIGFAFLFPGVGYGGSCFPKDVQALAATHRAFGGEPTMLDAVEAINARQKTILLEKLHQHFGGKLAGRRFALWGLSFKPRTDDIREAPALTMIDRLLATGAKVHVHDPEAMENVRRRYGDRLSYAQLPYDALDGADALLIMTEWKEFVHPDFRRMKKLLRSPVIFDGRNVYDSATMAAAGFTYYSIGRAPVGAK